MRMKRRGDTRSAGAYVGERKCGLSSVVIETTTVLSVHSFDLGYGRILCGVLSLKHGKATGCDIVGSNPSHARTTLIGTRVSARSCRRFSSMPPGVLQKSALGDFPPRPVYFNKEL